MVYWLGHCAVTDEGSGSIPGRGNKIPQAVWHGQNNNNNNNFINAKFVLYLLSKLQCWVLFYIYIYTAGPY